VGTKPQPQPQPQPLPLGQLAPPDRLQVSVLAVPGGARASPAWTSQALEPVRFQQVEETPFQAPLVASITTRGTQLPPPLGQDQQPARYR
jgi:hypothetical protein